MGVSSPGCVILVWPWLEWDFNVFAPVKVNEKMIVNITMECMIFPPSGYIH